MRDLYYDAVSIGANRVVIVGGRKGNPGVISVYEPVEPPEEQLRLLGRLTLQGVRLSRETPGAQRSYGARSLGVYVEGGSTEYNMIADVLMRLFNARLILDLDTAHRLVDVVAVVRPASGDHIVEITFICTGSGRQCGPLLRVKGVYDYVSGFRLHRGGVRGSQASESSG
jgi:U3 small nucleolar ribonucleoprotein protein IMP4